MSFLRAWFHQGISIHSMSIWWSMAGGYAKPSDPAATFACYKGFVPVIVNKY